MIQRANELLVDTYQVVVNDRLEAVYAADGSVTVVRDSRTNEPLPRHIDSRRQTTAVTRFRNYVGLVDATRYASRLLGYGLLQ